MAAARQETYGNKLAPYVVYCKYKTMNTIISDTHHANISTVYNTDFYTACCKTNSRNVSQNVCQR